MRNDKIKWRQIPPPSWRRSFPFSEDKSGFWHGKKRSSLPPLGPGGCSPAGQWETVATEWSHVLHKVPGHDGSPTPHPSPPSTCLQVSCIKKSFSGWKQTPDSRRADTEIFVTNCLISCSIMERKLIAVWICLAFSASGNKTILTAGVFYIPVISVTLILENKVSFSPTSPKKQQ